MKLYTKTGDAGTTSLADGRRVSKCCPRLDAYGSIDELNSHIGLLRSLIANTDIQIDTFLFRIQNDLFVIGGFLACAPIQEPLILMPLSDIEAEIDKFSAAVPPLRTFVLPAGTTAACQAHICRTVCRRAERSIWSITDFANINPLHSQVASYLNRLSDYLFILARFLNVAAGISEQTWNPSL